MKSNLENKKLLEESPISKLFARYAIPSVITFLFFGFQNLIDGVIVGNYIGSDALGGVNIILPFYSIMIVIELIIGIGSQTIVSIGIGEQKIQKAQNAITTGFWALLIIAFIITVILFLFSEKLALMLGANQEMLPFSLSYVKGLAPFIIPILLCFYSDAILKASGHPRFSMIIMSTIVLLNIILSMYFVIVLKLGVMGASLATGIAFTIGLLISGYIIFNPKQKLSMLKGKFKRNLLIKIVYNGSSEGVSELGSAATILIINLAVVKLAGADGVAAFTAINYINFTGVLIFLGVSDGLIPVLSYNYGAKNYNRVKAIFKFAARVNIIIGLLIFSIFHIWGSSIIQLFFDGNNPKVTEIAEQGLSIYSFVFLINGLNILTTSLFTSLENAKLSIVISALRSLVFVFIGVSVLSKYMGINGIWIALPLAEVFTLIVSLYLIYITNKRLLK